MCVCPHFLGATPKASLPTPVPIWEAPVAVCMLVTVVQNKFYLSLLYPELDLALHKPCPDLPQTGLVGTSAERVLLPAPQSELLGPGSSKAKPQALSTSHGFLPRCCPSLHPLPTGEERGFEPGQPRFESRHHLLCGSGKLTSVSELHFYFCEMGGTVCLPGGYYVSGTQWAPPLLMLNEAQDFPLWPPGGSEGSLTGTVEAESHPCGRSSQCRALTKERQVVCRSRGASLGTGRVGGGSPR